MKDEDFKAAESMRAEVIVHEGKRFICISDFKYALNDQAFLDYCATMLVVGCNINAPVDEIIQRVIGCALTTLSGDIAQLRIKRN